MPRISFACIACIALLCIPIDARAGGGNAQSVAPTSAARSTGQQRIYFIVGERFTHSGTLQFEGEEVPNSTGQYLDSSITTIAAGYRISPRFALQLNVPLIYRSFERPEGFTTDRDTESGLGDFSLLADAIVFLHESSEPQTVDFSGSKGPRIAAQESHLALAVSVLGGVKFPSGRTSRLKEESNEAKIRGAPESGIHGHDLTLGSGSLDGIFGAQIAFRYRAFFLQAGAFYDLRSEGAHQYEYADEVIGYGGPGLHFVRTRRGQFSLQFLISSRHKGQDRFRGEATEDSAFTSVLLGPRVLFSLGKWNGEIAVQLPVLLDNSGLQAVPDYQLSGNLSMRF